MLPTDMFLGSPGLAGSTMKLTPGVGMTLLIGVAGSIFLVAQSHRLLRSKLSQRRRSSRKPDVAECYMCNANVELENTDSFATCRGCERLVCRGENCCQWVESIGIWECTGCQSNRVIQQKAGEWLLNQLTARLQQPGPVELKDGNLLGLGLDADDARSTTSSTVSANQRIKVREFIEELLSAMLHGPLDDVSVGQLMKHESYLPLWEGQQQHHSPSDQHFELKRLIQKILEEIAKLPELLNHSGLPLRPEEHLPYFDPKKYEQLVATAVLNKVVDDYRNPKNFTGAGDVAAKPYYVGGGGGGGAVDLNHNQLTEGGGSHPKGALNAEALRQMSVTADDILAHEAAAAGYSAIDDRRLSDTEESYLSDYIQRHKVPLPDLSDTTTGSGSGAEDDDLQSLKSNATDGTWEENWLFRKRQLKTTESSIAMLVPSPTEEVKALIGDKNADEISDLSEAGSDCEGYESDSNVAPEVIKSEASPLTAGSSSKDETSEGLSSSSKPQDSLEEENFPADSLVSISSLPAEEALSEAKNSQLLGEQDRSAGTILEDLISIGPVGEKVETTNPTLTNPFMDDPFEVNNSVITDDVKLLQRTEASDNRSSEPSTNGHGDRKEIPIDRADHQQQAQQHHTHSNIYPSNPVADSVVEPVATGRPEGPPSSSVENGSSANGSGARETNLTNNATVRVNTNQSERLKPEVPPLLLLDSLSPPGSPVQQVLSPHPIMMTITDVFDRMASSSPLGAISEELPPPMLMDPEDSDPTFGVTPMEESFDQNSSPLTTISEELSVTVQLEGNEEDKPPKEVLLVDEADPFEESVAILEEGVQDPWMPISVVHANTEDVISTDASFDDLAKESISSPKLSNEDQGPIEPSSVKDATTGDVVLTDNPLEQLVEEPVPIQTHSEGDQVSIEQVSVEVLTSNETGKETATSSILEELSTSEAVQLVDEAVPAEMSVSSPVPVEEDQLTIDSISVEPSQNVSVEDNTLNEQPEKIVSTSGLSEDDQEPLDSISAEVLNTGNASLDEISESVASPVQSDEEQQLIEPIQATPDAVLSPMDSIQDDSEYRTVSEATNNSLLLVESFEELGPFSMSDMPHDPNSLQRCEEEFSSIVEQSESDNAEEQEQQPIVTAQPSPDLLQIRETPPAAVYVRDQEQKEFSEQLKILNEPSVDEIPNRNPFQKEEGDTDKPSQITLHADLVTFDNSIPSPERNPGIVAVAEQMRAYCEELKGILNRPSEEEVKPAEEELDQWEMVEPPEALEALDAFGEELQWATEEPTVSEVRPCKDHPIREMPLLELEEPFASPIEIGSIRMADYSESLKNIEYVEEAIAMDEEVQIISDASVELEERSSEAFTVSSPEPSHHSVTVLCTPSTEDPPSQMEVPSSAVEATESFPLQSTSAEETMLASIESRSESKIDDTSMPFSDSDLPSLSSPSTTTTTVTASTTTTTINNCMSTNITDQVSTPTYISTSTIDIDTNPSNNTRFVSELTLDVPLSLADAPSQSSIVADCSIIPAQKTAEQQAPVESNGHHTQAVPVDGGMDEQNRHQPSLDEADTLIPGSIAEREHLKWRNAKPIANNPYSPDALQRRLSEKSRPSSMIEIERLVKKDAAPNGSAVVLLDDEEPPKEPVDSGTENDRSLQSVIGGGLSEKKKIGREYYINDPERLRAGGGVMKQTLGVEQKQQHQQLSHSTDDEKSLLLGRNVDDGEPNQLKLVPGSGTSLPPRDPSAENVFAARPVQVTSDDPILKRGTKVNHLSMAARDVFLVPVEPEPHGSLISSSSEVSINSPTSSSGARPELDSLSYSEDSDVTRIYDLTTGEAKVFRSGVPAQSETILQILPQIPSPVYRASGCPSPTPAPVTPKPTSPVGSQDERGFLRPGQFAVKPLSPETIKFFAPKRKLSFTGSSSNLASGEAAKAVTSSPGHTMHSSLHIDFPATRSTNGSEFSIIEKDVIDVLPSVKELAKCYSGSCSEVSTMPPKPLYKPRVKLRKDFLRQSSDVLNEDGSSGAMPDAGTKGQRQYSSTSSIAVRDEIREIRKINLEAYRQQSTFYPMAPGHSITARSLSKQIREHKTNVTDDHKVGQHEELPGSNGNGGGGDGEGEGDGVGSGVDGGHASPERPSSPVFLPGHLKTSIEFFESLRNKP